MPLQKPLSHRRAASTFIQDDNEINLIQLSPHRDLGHLEQRSPFTMTTNQESKTNFIGDCLLPTEIPRAFAVTKTGEKQLLNLDCTTINKSSSNPFTIHSPRYSEPTMARISEKSSSQLALSSDKLNKSSGRLNKKLKAPKRHIGQKHRLSFTPRNTETNSSTQIPAAEYNKISRYTNSKSCEITHNTSTETQTDNFSSFTTNRYISKPYKPTTSCRLDYTAIASPRLNFNENIIKDFNKQQRLYSTNTEPLRIYTKSNPNLEKYSELRSFASAITLITVVSWLFATFFDIECLWDYLERFWQYFQNWFLIKEKPKTKVELLVTFIRDLWS